MRVDLHCLIGWVALAVMGLWGAACQPAQPGNPNAAGEPGDPVPSAQAFAERAPSTADLAQFHVRLQVEVDGQAMEPVTIRLWPEAAPETVRNFLRLCRSHFYDGLTFHRILRDLMVQGGCTVGDGTGASPFGTLPAEFHSDDRYRHRYGVMSMARGPDPNSAGAQFFVICRDGPMAWNLDGQYASFGEWVDGGEVLEAIANVPVARNAQGELAKPKSTVRILTAKVVAGPAPAGRIQAPELEASARWGPPNTVSVQSLMIAYGEPGTGAPRSRADAQAFAQELKERWEAGTPLADLIRAHSEDPVQRGQSDPVGFHFARKGSQPLRGQREVFLAHHRIRQALADVQHRKHSKEWSAQRASEERDRLQWELQRTIRAHRAIPEDEWPDLAAAAFSLEVGELTTVTSDRTGPFQGVFLLRRSE